MSKPTADMCPRAFITGVVPLNALDRGGLLTPLHWLFTSSFLFRRPAYFVAVCTFTVWHGFSFCYHFTLSAQYAADIFPLEMLLACLALNDLRLAFISADSPAFGFPAVLAPCSPKRIVLILSPDFATTTCDFFGWLGVRLGLLYPLTPALDNRESFIQL